MKDIKGKSFRLRQRHWRPLFITSYFNPYGFRSKERNYLEFRENLERLGVPLLCVEQVFDGVRVLSGPGDIKVCGGDILWQREALLQIGIEKALADGWERLVLSDCDVVIESSEALERIQLSFDVLDFFQPFESVELVYSDFQIKKDSDMKKLVRTHGIGAGLTGIAWAATAAFLHDVNLYPFALLGGGDIALSHIFWLANRYGLESARFRYPSRFWVNWLLFPELEPSLLEWLKNSEVGRWRLGFSAGVVLRTLPHGSFRLRKYQDRYKPWRNASFGAPIPGRDFRIGECGLLEWSERENRWRASAEAYFRERQEDL